MHLTKASADTLKPPGSKAKTTIIKSYCSAFLTKDGGSQDQTNTYIRVTEDYAKTEQIELVYPSWYMTKASN